MRRPELLFDSAEANAASSPEKTPRLPGVARFFLIRVGALFVLLIGLFVGYISDSQWLLTLVALGLLIVAIANFWAKPNTIVSIVPIAQCSAWSATGFLLATRYGRPYVSLVHIYWSLAHILSLAAFVLSAVGFAIGFSIAVRSKKRVKA